MLALAIGLATGLATGSGCVTADVVAVPGAGASGAPMFEHTRLGYRVADPSAPGASFGTVASGSPGGSGPASGGSEGWHRISVEDADLAFQRGRGSRQVTMVIASRCGVAAAPLPVLARHLLIGIGRREWIDSGPAVVAGGEAWIQWVETRGEGPSVRIKTVTTRLDGCLVDWVLAGTGGFERALPDFDRWWASFERPARGGRP